jgi:hypothetical protein
MDNSKTRKSRRVGITLLGATAAVVMGLASGCSNNNTTAAHCVDASGHIVPDSQCSSSGYNTGYYGGSGYYGHHSSWVYGGSVNNNRVSGYSTSAPSSGDISTDSGHVVRGGFGGSGGFGGGHGGGGGGE